LVLARILYFTRDYTTHDHRFLTALAKTSHQAFYLRLEQRGHSLEDRSLPPEVELVKWAGGQAPARLRDGPALLLDLKRVIRRVKPDLIQTGPVQTAALLSVLSGFRPVVSMSWGYDLLIDAERSPVWRWATRFTLQHSAALVCDCETIRHKAIGYGMDSQHILAFPWGVDLKHYTPLTGFGEPEPAIQQLSQGWGPDAFLLLSTRSWEPIYGVDLLARAFVLAAQQRPELRLLMLGNGSLAPRLRQIFIQGQVTDRVYTPGQVGQADLPRFYRAADLYVSTSHSDGTSISLLEAMACGKPVLLSDIPGNREWVTPGEQGWWFKDGDLRSLTEAILQAVESRQQLPEMGQAARQLVELRADWERNFPKLFEAYQLAGVH
jgi:glycosyltransferase involved in cell wall biosynthesis